MTDPNIRKKEKVTMTSVKKQQRKRMVRNTFARAFQRGCDTFSPKRAKLSGASQINRFSGNYLLYITNSILGIVSWWVVNWTMKIISMFFLCPQHCLHQISLWSETTILLRIWRRLVGAFEFSRISRRDRLWEEKKMLDFLVQFWFYCAVLCQGQCFQFSSPNSLKRWR